MESGRGCGKSTKTMDRLACSGGDPAVLIGMLDSHLRGKDE